MNDYSNKPVGLNGTSEPMVEDRTNKRQREDVIGDVANSSLATAKEESPAKKLKTMQFSENQYIINGMPNEIFATFISPLSPFNRLALSTVCKQWNAFLDRDEAWSDEMCDFLNVGPEFMTKRMRFVKKAIVDFGSHTKFLCDVFERPGENWSCSHKFKFINYSEMVVALCKKNGGFFRFCNEDQRKDLSFVYMLILKIPKAQYGNLLMCASNEMKSDIRLQYIVNFCGKVLLSQQAIRNPDIDKEESILNKQQKNKIVQAACADIERELRLK